MVKKKINEIESEPIESEGSGENLDEFESQDYKESGVDEYESEGLDDAVIIDDDSQYVANAEQELNKRKHNRQKEYFQGVNLDEMFQDIDNFHKQKEAEVQPLTNVGQGGPEMVNSHPHQSTNEMADVTQASEGNFALNH